MARVRIKCNPQLNTAVHLSGPADHYVLIGRIRDSPRKHPVKFDADANFVVLEVGKRGSGKSFCMGAALEAFATEQESCSIANHGDDRRGVLLLDPLDTHWTAIYPIQDGVSDDMREQYRLLSRWPEIQVDPVRINVFMPAGREQPEDPDEFKPFQLPVTDLTADDLAMLYGANVISDPAGMLLFELHDKVTRLGYHLDGVGVPPKAVFGLQDLVACLDDDEINDPARGYTTQTIRAVGQRLRTWLTDPLFQSDVGTPVSDLVRAGQLSVLCLNRVSDDVRSVVAGVLVRKIKAARTRASQAARRQAFDPNAGEFPDAQMPRTIIAIDEAQMILPPSGGGPARKAIESYILEGRNFGLSIWLATQRPRGAVSQQAVSQVDTLIAHRLSSADDLKAVKEMIQSAMPSTTKVNDNEVDFDELIRSLDVGLAVVSSETAPRTFVMEGRPRVVAHGGKAF